MARSIEPTGVERHFGRDESSSAKTDPRPVLPGANQVFPAYRGIRGRRFSDNRTASCAIRTRRAACSNALGHDRGRPRIFAYVRTWPERRPLLGVRARHSDPRRLRNDHRLPLEPALSRAQRDRGRWRRSTGAPRRGEACRRRTGRMAAATSFAPGRARQNGDWVMTVRLHPLDRCRAAHPCAGVKLPKMDTTEIEIYQRPHRAGGGESAGARRANGDLRRASSTSTPRRPRADLMRGINHLLDMTDAFVREAGATLEHAAVSRLMVASFPAACSARSARARRASTARRRMARARRGARQRRSRGGWKLMGRLRVAVNRPSTR